MRSLRVGSITASVLVLRVAAAGVVTTTETTTPTTSSTESTSTETTTTETTSTQTTTTETTTTSTSTTTLPLCVPVIGPRLNVKHVLPPQDGDALLLRGALTLTPPVALELDPTGHGIELQLSDDGVVVLDVSIPAGAFGPTKTGWKTNREGTTWTYVGPKTGAPGGIRKAVFHDQGVRNPGRVLLRIVGKAGSYGITTPHLAANVILPASGICFEALFPATPPARPGCTLVKASLVCK